MNISKILKDKKLKPKAKTEALAKLLAERKLKVKALITYAEKTNDSEKATCIEAFEFASRLNVKIASESLLDFTTEMLLARAPRVKWESAKVIGNIARLYPEKLDRSIANLLINAENESTVVRWAAAFALGEILKLKTKHFHSLSSAIKNIIAIEEKNSIKKIYLSALK